MIQRVKAALPLSVSIAILVALWLETAFNFSFHWSTAGSLGNGLELPTDFQLIAPAAFISWGVFFAAGADRSGFVQALISSAIGATGGLGLMVVAPRIADLPDFWSIAGTASVLALVLVLASATGPWYYTPGVILSFAAVMFWWAATGLDGWASNGGGVGNSPAALKDPATAGAGAFGGVLSTPAIWVYASSLVSLICGCLLGLASVRLAGVLSPKALPRTSPTSSPANADSVGM